MGNEDISKRLDSSQEALDHTDSNPLAADEVISDLIRDIWGEDPKRPSTGTESEDPKQLHPVMQRIWRPQGTRTPFLCRSLLRSRRKPDHRMRR